MPMKKSIVIIPTYNEKENIEDIVRKVFTLDGFSVLIVDDGSPDGTGDIVKKLQAEFPDLHILERKGKIRAWHSLYSRIQVLFRKEF